MNEVRDNTRRLDRIQDNLLTKDEFRKAMEADEYRTFNNRDKMIATAIAALVLITEIVNTIYFISH